MALALPWLFIICAWSSISRAAGHKSVFGKNSTRRTCTFVLLGLVSCTCILENTLDTEPFLIMGSGRSVRELTLPEIQIGRHLPLASGPKPPQFRFSTASHGPPSASSVGLQDELGEGSTAAHLVVGGMLPSPLGIEQGARGFTSTLAASERQPALSATGASVGKHTSSLMTCNYILECCYYVWQLCRLPPALH